VDKDPEILNWRLILAFASLGPALGLASVYGITDGLETPIWLLLAIATAIGLGRRAPRQAFLHGVLTGVLAAGSVPLVHAALLPTYLAHSAAFAEQMSQVPARPGPRAVLLLSAPLWAAAGGLGLGVSAWAAGRVFARGGGSTGEDRPA